MKRFHLHAHINVIPYNPVEGSDFQRPTRANVVKFTSALDAAGITNSTRITRGLEASAACGQLRNQNQKTPVDNIAILT
jgi:23S rRNA (adenine2503-C2)-methyltransferase